jgi:hypothetical protein
MKKVLLFLALPLLMQVAPAFAQSAQTEMVRPCFMLDEAGGDFQPCPVLLPPRPFPRPVPTPLPVPTDPLPAPVPFPWPWFPKPLPRPVPPPIHCMAIGICPPYDVPMDR